MEIAQQIEGRPLLGADLLEQLRRLPGLVQGVGLASLKTLADGPGEERHPQLAADLGEPLRETFLLIALDVEDGIPRLNQEP